MMEAKILLELTPKSMTIDVRGDQAALLTLLVYAAENNTDFEQLLQDTLDIIGKRRVDEATSNLS